VYAIFQALDAEETVKDGLKAAGRNVPSSALITAFTHGSNSGAVFVEAAMTPELRHLLRRISGLKMRKGEPIFTFVPPGVRLAILHPPKIRELRFSTGQWVRILKGTYTNDIGFVKKLENWGGLQLLLVPRIAPLPAAGPSASFKGLKRSRRSRASRPSLALFDPLEIQKMFQRAPQRKAAGTYCFGGQTFEHGLLVKTVDASSASCCPISIPSELAALFLRSKHPSVIQSKFPSPLEWAFAVEDFVDIDKGPFSGKQGWVKVVQPDQLEVELYDGTRIVCDWYDVRKWIVAGDYVTVSKGTAAGHAGFVDGVTPTHVRIFERYERKPDGTVALVIFFASPIS
jgi:transcription antitermination factor NusG